MSIKGIVKKYKKWIILGGCAVGVLRIMEFLPDAVLGQTPDTSRLIYAGALFAAGVVYLMFHKEPDYEGYSVPVREPQPHYQPTPRRYRQPIPRPVPRPQQVPVQDPVYADSLPEDVGDDILASEMGMPQPRQPLPKQPVVRRNVDEIYDGFK